MYNLKYKTYNNNVAMVDVATHRLKEPYQIWFFFKKDAIIILGVDR